MNATCSPFAVPSLVFVMLSVPESSISVFNGSAYTAKRAEYLADIIPALHTTGEDTLFWYDGSGTRIGEIAIIYAADGTVEIERINLHHSVSCHLADRWYAITHI